MASIAYVFSGQGAQYPGMGKELYKASPAARRAFDAADAMLPGTLEKCFEGTQEELSKTINTQPCLFVMDYACAVAVSEEGISPNCLAGFSLGEVAAAAFAGVLSYEHAFRFVIRRAQEMQACAQKYPGAMGAVLRLTVEQVEQICLEFSGRAYPVNYNCPGQTVVAYDENVFYALSKRVAEARGRVIRLAVSGAFHTPWMREATEALKIALEEEQLLSPTLPLYANATAGLYTQDNAVRLLTNQVSRPVRWQESVENMCAAGIDTFVEVGAGKTLCGLIRKIAPKARVFNVEKPADLEKLKEEI